MTDTTVPNVTTVPNKKSRVFNKTIAIRVAVAATAVTVVAVVFVLLKNDSSSVEEIVEAVTETAEV